MSLVRHYTTPHPAFLNLHGIRIGVDEIKYSADFKMLKFSYPSHEMMATIAMITSAIGTPMATGFTCDVLNKAFEYGSSISRIV